VHTSRVPFTSRSLAAGQRELEANQKKKTEYFQLLRTDAGAVHGRATEEILNGAGWASRPKGKRLGNVNGTIAEAVLSKPQLLHLNTEE